MRSEEGNEEIWWPMMGMSLMGSSFAAFSMVNWVTEDGIRCKPLLSTDAVVDGGEMVRVVRCGSLWSAGNKALTSREPLMESLLSRGGMCSIHEGERRG